MLFAVLLLAFGSAQATYYYRQPTYYYRQPTYYYRYPTYNAPAPAPPPPPPAADDSANPNAGCDAATLLYISRYFNLMVPLLCPRIRPYCSLFRTYAVGSDSCQVRFRAQKVVDLCCPQVPMSDTTTIPDTTTTAEVTTTTASTTTTQAATTQMDNTDTAATTTTTEATTTTTEATTTTTTEATTTTPRPCGESTISPASRSAMLDTIRLTLRIVGGTTATECEYPWMARLQVGGYLCGGAILDETHILTAAHCLDGVDVNEVTVTLGDYNMQDTSGREQEISASSLTMHENYDPDTFQHDIAIIELARPIGFDGCVSAICIPETTVPTSTKCTVAGWGTTTEGGTVSNVLQEVEVPVYSSNDCTSEFPDYGDLIHGTTLCAGYASGGMDACQGDSGGPLMCPSGNSWVVAGVVSSGYGCARENYPGLYTDVASYNDWITANV